MSNNCSTIRRMTSRSKTDEAVDLTGGRIETRRHTVCHKVDRMTSDRHYPGEPVFPDLAMIGRIETTVERNGKIEQETRYYLCSLALEVGRATVQHVAGYERQRRHAARVASVLDVTASLTDQAIDLFDRLVGAMFRKAEGRQARAFQAEARAINEKVRLYARIGAALIVARDTKHDAYGAITAVLPWDRFCKTVAEAQTLARPDEFDAYQLLGEHYAGSRRWSPAFLEAFEFESVPASAPLMRAITLLRETNRTGAATLPESPPTSFVRQRWVNYALPGGAIDRRYYELCVLSELRDRLRAGDVWVAGSRQHRSFEERLISQETQLELKTTPPGQGICTRKYHNILIFRARSGHLSPFGDPVTSPNTRSGRSRRG
jgi:hypothetical protein